MIESFSTIDPDETVILSFEFAEGFPTPETITSSTVTCSVYSGIDPTPMSFIKQHVMIGTKMDVTVGTGINNVVYKIKASVSSVNRTLVLYGKILVHQEI